MTPKEKAEKLFNGFFSIIPTPDYDEYLNPLKTHKERAKQCTLIAVQEIINFGNKAGIREPMMYWNKVEQEIKKL
jgi:hypothetical protein